MQATFNGRRIVVFSGGEAKDLEGLFTEVRGLRDGGANGSIIGRNTFQRPRAEALDMLDKIISIYQGQDARTGHQPIPRRALGNQRPFRFGLLPEQWGAGSLSPERPTNGAQAQGLYNLGRFLRPRGVGAVHKSRPRGLGRREQPLPSGLCARGRRRRHRPGRDGPARRRAASSCGHRRCLHRECRGFRGRADRPQGKGGAVEAAAACDAELVERPGTRRAKPPPPTKKKKSDGNDASARRRLHGRGRARRDKAIAAVQAALDKAGDAHDRIVQDLKKAQAELDRKSGAEEARWEKEKEKLQDALRRARTPRHLRLV